MTVDRRRRSAGLVWRAFRCLRALGRGAVLLVAALYLIALAVQPAALKQWLGCVGLVFFAAAVVPLLRMARVLRSHYGAIAAAAGAVVAGVASVRDVRQGWLGAGEDPWTGALVFASALVLVWYLSGAAILEIHERFCQSRLYHRVVDQDALNGLLEELGGDAGNNDPRPDRPPL